MKKNKKSGLILKIFIAVIPLLFITALFIWDALKDGIDNPWAYGIGLFLVCMAILPFYVEGVKDFWRIFAGNEREFEECTVIYEKLVVYSKSHESFGILTELPVGSKLFIDFNISYGRFYKVHVGMPDNLEGFILKTSKYQRPNS